MVLVFFRKTLFMLFISAYSFFLFSIYEYILFMSKLFEVLLNGEILYWMQKWWFLPYISIHNFGDHHQWLEWSERERQEVLKGNEERKTMNEWKRETRGRLRPERDLVRGTMEMKVNPRRVGPPPSPTPHLLQSVHGV